MITLCKWGICVDSKKSVVQFRLGSWVCLWCVGMCLSRRFLHYHCKAYTLFRLILINLSILIRFMNSTVIIKVFIEHLWQPWKLCGCSSEKNFSIGEIKRYWAVSWLSISAIHVKVCIIISLILKRYAQQIYMYNCLVLLQELVIYMIFTFHATYFSVL